MFTTLGLAILLTQPRPVENQDLLRQKLETRVGERLSRVDGVIGVWIKDLTSGEEMGFDAGRLFPAASSIKVALLLELYRQAGEGRYRLSDRHRVSAAERTPGSGVLLELGDGTVEMTLKDLATLMITVSDNTATNILIDRVGMDSVNATLDHLGLGRTRLRRKMMALAEQARGNENVSTPEELGRLMEKIFRAEVLSAEACREMMDILSRPKTGQIRDLLPPEIQVAHKTGGISGVRNDVGVVLLEGRPFIVSAMSNLVRDEAEAQRAIAEVSRLAFDYFERLALANPFGARMPKPISKR
jgi:beta-lactamase class A